jgi:hypothetical protein
LASANDNRFESPMSIDPDATAAASTAPERACCSSTLSPARRKKPIS